jgi:tetratricopeptide (TPR) repeat protein
VAEEIGNPTKLAAVLDGMANAHRDRGNLPRAREVLQEVLEIGRETGDRYSLAIGHHDLMTVEKLRGDRVEAIRHGWLAVQSYDSNDGRLRALFDLAGVLRDNGELQAAWDAYVVVVAQVEGLEARILALDALAYVAALRGDREQHQKLRMKLDAEGWENVSPVYRGQVLFYRGLSLRALGDEREGRKWLNKALAFAAEHSLNKIIFDAEAALEERTPVLAEQPVPPIYGESTPEEVLGVCRGLREMREAQASVGELV